MTGSVRQHAVHRLGHQWQAGERITKRTQFTRCGAPCGRFAGQSLHIAHPIECVTQRRAPHRVAHQGRHGIETLFNGRLFQQRREQPLPKHAVAHGRGGAIEHRQQGAVVVALITAQRFHQLRDCGVSSRRAA